MNNITPTTIKVSQVASVFGTPSSSKRNSSNYPVCFGVGCPLHDCLKYKRLDGVEQFEDSDRMGTCYSNSEKKFIAYERPEDSNKLRFDKIVESISKYNSVAHFANPCTGKEEEAWNSLTEDTKCPGTV